MRNNSTPLKVAIASLSVSALLVTHQYQQTQPNISLQGSLQKQGGVRGLQKKKKNDMPLFTPLNGFAFGEGSGVSFANGQSFTEAEKMADSTSTSKTVGAGGGFGGGVGYVNAFDVGSAYGGGNGGGNVSSIESKYGVNAGSYTAVGEEGVANSTFNGVSAGGGFGSGIFGGLFVMDPDQSLSDALSEAADDLANSNSKDGKGKDKDKESVNLQEAAASLTAGFYASFGNTTGGGGGGFGFTGLQASGIVSAPSGNGYESFATANSGVNASANGFGFGGGKTNVGNTTASGGGFGGGQANGDAGGDIDANQNAETDGGGVVEFNATGGGGANGGGAGFVGIGLNPAEIAGAYDFNP